MGRRNSVPPDRFTIAPKMRLVRLRWVSGDYDQGGAYWGNSGGTSIYQARGENPLAAEPQDEICEVFVRASNRAAAKVAVREFFPKATFHN